MEFLGYRRPDGKVGIRNHVLILPTVSCSSETCRIIASQVKGSVNLIVQAGCAEVEGNEEMTQAVLTGFAANPNVYGTVVVGLGCENVPAAKLADKISKITNKPIAHFEIQEIGGTVNTINQAVRAARKMAEDASVQSREVCDISELMIATECGGSDATSGLAANPVVGNVSDKIVDAGGSSMMSETTEFVGAEHILARRGATPEIHDEIIKICRDLEIHLGNVNQDLRTGQPTPGNKEGGLSTIEEKSLGCIYKGGTRPIVEVVKCSHIPTKKGCIVMDTPGYDTVSVSAMAAGGCQVMLFTTGRGTPTGLGIMPVIKVTGNKHTYEHMKDNMDFDTSDVISGTKTIDQLGDELLNELLLVCNGKITKAESYGFSDVAINRMCSFI